jgi:hypothetical protein
MVYLYPPAAGTRRAAQRTTLTLSMSPSMSEPFVVDADDPQRDLNRDRSGY